VTMMAHNNQTEPLMRTPFLPQLARTKPSSNVSDKINQCESLSEIHFCITPAHIGRYSSRHARQVPTLRPKKHGFPIIQPGSNQLPTHPSSRKASQSL
jgi:hypothetical protein